MVAAFAVPPGVGLGRQNVADWSHDEVNAFLETVLPGHPCAVSFAHMSGKVLCTLSKQDLRHRAHDEEAANVIWAEVRRLLEAHREREAIRARGGWPQTVYIRTPADVSVELEVLPTDTIGELKARIAATEGTPVEMQRLTRNGVPMLDSRTLASYSVSHGSVLLLVPRLALSSRYAPLPARNSHVSGIPRPRVPMVCTDIARPFPMSLEFEGVPEYQAFMLALQRHVGRRDATTLQNLEADVVPFLEILAATGAQAPVQTRISFDAEAEVLRVDTVGDILMECTRYRVLLHLKKEQRLAVLVTGVRGER